MSGKSCILIGIVLAGLAVVIGAFGAHGLEKQLSYLEPTAFAKKLDNWKTGAMYQFFHALGIISIGTLMILNRGPQSWLGLAATLMLLGTFLFSGLLYLMTLTDYRLGMVVPIGGVSFIAGWIAFAMGAIKLKT